MLAECLVLGCHSYLLCKHGPGELEFLLFRTGFRNTVFKLFLWLALLRRGLVCSGNRASMQHLKQKRIYATSPSSLVSQKYPTSVQFAQTCVGSDWGVLFSFITVLKDSSGPSQTSVAQSDSEDDGEFQSQSLCDC